MNHEETLDIVDLQVSPHWITRVAAITSIVLGIVVMLGWIFGIDPLTSVLRGLVAMQFNTAICFVLLGIALWLLSSPEIPRTGRHLAQLCAFAVMTIGAATLTQYLTGRDFAIDQLLFKIDTAPLNVFYPGRMSPHSAINFMLAGMALLAIDYRFWRQYPAQWAAIGILFIALMALIGQTYRVDLLYPLSRFTGMALNTALAFVVFGIGLLFVRPQQGLAALLLAQGSGGAMTRRLLPAAILVPVLLSGFAIHLSREHGAAGSELGFATVIALTIMFLAASIWRIGHLLNVLDAKREQAFDDLRESNTQLDQMVAARTAELAKARDVAEIERQWLHTSLMSIEDAVIATDADSRITILNPAAERLTGWTQDDALGRAAREVLPLMEPQTDIPLEHPVELSLAGSSATQVCASALLITRDGTRIAVEHSAAPIRDQAEQVLGVVLVVRDISERMRTEQALRDADARKDHFLAMLGHELRNPLAPLSNAVQIIRLAEGDGRKAGRALDIVERQVEHLSRLVDDLLDISRIALGKLEFRKVPEEVQAIVERAVEITQPMLEERGHQLTIQVPQSPIMVEADATRLVQALGNILTNAAKYTPNGGAIGIVVELESEQVAIRIRDNGMGIPAHLLPNVFVLFEQLSPSSSHSQSGLGIGLALTKQLVEHHHGSIEAHSAGVDQGSEFIVRLPILAE